MPPDRDAACVADMIQACREIRAFVAGLDKGAFLADARTQGAVIHRLLILGEAAKRTSESLHAASPDVPWSLIARTRDILIHHYQNVDLHEVWKITDSDIPNLLSALERIGPAA